MEDLGGDKEEGDEVEELGHGVRGKGNEVMTRLCRQMFQGHQAAVTWKEGSSC